MSLLDDLLSIKPVYRLHFGRNKDVKPNDHCIWCEPNMFCFDWGWVETDEHFRSRIKLEKNNDC